MILRNYHDIHFILDMEIPNFIEQLAILRERELEQKTWELWLVMYPNMNQDNFMTYEDMLEAAKQKLQAQTVEEPEPDGVYINQVLF